MNDLGQGGQPACRTAAAEHDAESQTDADSAVEGSQQRVGGRNGKIARNKHEQRQDHRSEQGADRIVAPQQQETRDKQRDVQSPLRISRLDAEQRLGDDRQTGHSARSDMVRYEKQVKGQRGNKRTDDNHQSIDRMPYRTGDGNIFIESAFAGFWRHPCPSSLIQKNSYTPAIRPAAASSGSSASLPAQRLCLGVGNRLISGNLRLSSPRF
ncbi:hypothetical protein D1872_234730 [compost metagenome]